MSAELDPQAVLRAVADPAWQGNGHIECAVEHVAAWVRSLRIAGLRVHVLRLEGRTPLLWLEAPVSKLRS